MALQAWHAAGGSASHDMKIRETGVRAPLFGLNGIRMKLEDNQLVTSSINSESLMVFRDYTTMGSNQFWNRIGILVSITIYLKPSAPRVIKYSDGFFIAIQYLRYVSIWRNQKALEFHWRLPLWQIPIRKLIRKCNMCSLFHYFARFLC